MDREYRRNFYGHPDHAKDGSVDYRFLIAIWNPSGKTVKLYVTSQTAIEPVDSYFAIGVGDYLAHYLVSEYISPGISQRDALIHASYALTAVKDFVPQCGGLSIYLLLQNDGRLGITTSKHAHVVSEVEDYAKMFDHKMRSILLTILSQNESEASIASTLSRSFNELMEARSKWMEKRRNTEENFRALNTALTEGQIRYALEDYMLALPPRPFKQP